VVTNCLFARQAAEAHANLADAVVMVYWPVDAQPCDIS
jgi:hypothetical protein